MRLSNYKRFETSQFRSLTCLIYYIETDPSSRCSTLFATARRGGNNNGKNGLGLVNICIYYASQTRESDRVLTCSVDFIASGEFEILWVR